MARIIVQNDHGLTIGVYLDGPNGEGTDDDVPIGRPVVNTYIADDGSAFSKGGLIEALAAARRTEGRDPRSGRRVPTEAEIEIWTSQCRPAHSRLPLIRHVMDTRKIKSANALGLVMAWEKSGDLTPWEAEPEHVEIDISGKEK